MIFDSSKKVFLRALSISPDNNILKNNYANLLIDMKAYAEAASILSCILLTQSDYDDARENLQRARSLLSLDPSITTANLSNPTQLNEISSDTDKRLDDLLDPLLMAFAPDEVRDHGRLKSLTELNDLVDNADNRSIGLEKLKLAQKALVENNPRFALQLCTQAYNQLGSESAIFDVVSDAYLKLNRFLDSEISILHALQLSGPSIKLYINLVSLASMRCDFKLAEYYFDKAVCLDSGNENLIQLREFLDKRKLSKSNSPFLFEDIVPSSPINTGFKLITQFSSSTIPDFGIVYVATGESYNREAIS